MKTRSPKTEQLVLLTALYSPNLANYVVVETDIDDFGTKEGQEIRTRISKFVKAGKAVPQPAVFLDALPEAAGEFLNVGEDTKECACKTTAEELTVLIDKLRNLRKSRVLLSAMTQVSDLCAKWNSNDMDELWRKTTKLLGGAMFVINEHLDGNDADCYIAEV
jgi:hypothetical protein